MKFRILMATATAAGVLMAGAALAANTNTLYLTQSGDENVADVWQSGGLGKNDIGLAGAPILQQGNKNEFKFSDKSNNYGGNNDIVAGSQIGNGNFFSNSTWNNANNNVIHLFTQAGSSNWARVNMNGSDTGDVASILQDGDKNFLVISQSGSYSTGNRIGSVSMIGSNNGLLQDANGAENRAGTYLYQSGNGNTISTAYLEGSNNIGPYGGSSVSRNAQQIIQNGNNNGVDLSVASTLGSQNGAYYNRLWVFETGDDNNFSIRQGVNDASFGNHAVLIQNGNGNLGTAIQYGNLNNFEVTQTGSYNVVNSSQTGDSNSIVATISGDLNGAGHLGGVAGTLAGSSLSSGDILQSGNSNSASLTITLSSSNQFAFKQTGNSNQIVGKVSGSGSNSAAVVQGGNSNVSHFTQIGGSNVVAVSQ